MRVFLLGLILIHGVAFSLDRVEFIQHFEGKYLAVIGEGLPVCLKVSNNQVRAVNKKDVCAKLQRASMRKDNRVCVKPMKPMASARCELTKMMDNGVVVMGASERPIQAYHSKKQLVQALKSQKKGVANPLGKLIGQ